MYTKHIYITMRMPNGRLILNEDFLEIPEYCVISKESYDIVDNLIKYKVSRVKGFEYRYNSNNNSIEVIDPDDGERCATIIFYLPSEKMSMHKTFHNITNVSIEDELHCLIAMNILVDKSGAIMLIDAVKLFLNNVAKLNVTQITSGSAFNRAIQYVMQR